MTPINECDINIMANALKLQSENKSLGRDIPKTSAKSSDFQNPTITVSSLVTKAGDPLHNIRSMILWGVRFIDISLETNEYINSVVLSAL